MDFRWLKLQGLAVLLGLGLLAVGSVVFEFQPGDVTPLYVLLFLGSYFIIFAGVHVYLGIRGEGGAITVDARWRFVVVVALVLSLGTVTGLVASRQRVNGIDMGLTIGVLALFVFVGYFVYEIREGYRTGSESELE
jgi:hypothetical protein